MRTMLILGLLTVLGCSSEPAGNPALKGCDVKCDMDAQWGTCDPMDPDSAQICSQCVPGCTGDGRLNALFVHNPDGTIAKSVITCDSTTGKAGSPSCVPKTVQAQ